MRGGTRLWVTGLVGAPCLFAALPDALAKPYKGAELYSQQAFLYGRMAMRMRMASGSGILSTFFTYKDGSEADDTFWEEVDIEVFGKDNATSWQSNIITGLGTRTTSEDVHTLPASLADDYHTYALVWTPDYVAWELDGVEVRRTTTSQVQDLSSPQSLRFNVWAANIASWVGTFDDAVLPQYQFVNWLSYSSYQDGEFVHEWTDEFDTFDQTRWGRADWTFEENLADFDPSNVLVHNGTLVLAFTHEGQTGFSGAVPEDTEGQAGSSGAPARPEAGGSGGIALDGGSGGVASSGDAASTAGEPTTSETGGSDGMALDGGGGSVASSAGTVGASAGNGQGGQETTGTGGAGHTPNPTSTEGDNTVVENSGSEGAAPDVSGAPPSPTSPTKSAQGCALATSSTPDRRGGAFAYLLLLVLGAVSRSRRRLKGT